MSTFGRVFRVTTYGESHGASVGAIVDGVPPVSVHTDDETHLNHTYYRVFLLKRLIFKFN